MSNFNFPPTSRYHGIEIASLKREDGRIVAYLRRRTVPPLERFALLREHVVVQGDRLDNVTAQHMGDPEAFWRVADANTALHPEHLTAQVGRRIRITLPEGIPATPNA